MFKLSKKNSSQSSIPTPTKVATRLYDNKHLVKLFELEPSRILTGYKQDIFKILFHLFSSFQYSQRSLILLSMTWFELLISGVGGQRSTNCAPQPLPICIIFERQKYASKFIRRSMQARYISSFLFAEAPELLVVRVWTRSRRCQVTGFRRGYPKANAPRVPPFGWQYQRSR